MRNWYRSRGESADRLVIPSFILGDPWQTICVAAVPFWVYFSVQPALQSLDAYLTEAEPYAEANVFLFEHGAESPGIATPEQFAAVLRRHGIAANFQGSTENVFRTTSAPWAATARFLINCLEQSSRKALCQSRTHCAALRPPACRSRGRGELAQDLSLPREACDPSCGSTSPSDSSPDPHPLRECRCHRERPA